MRIGFDATVLTQERTAEANYLVKLVRGLIRENPRLEIVLFAPDKICVDYDPWINFPQVTRRDPHISRVERKKWAAFNLPRLAKENAIDVLHLPAGVRTRLFRSPCPVVITIHDLTPWLRPGVIVGFWRNFRYKLRALIWTRLADKVLTVSESAKKDIARLCCLPEANITVVYPGADDIHPDVPTKEEDAGHLKRWHLDGKRYIICPSGLSAKRRNLDLVLNGFAQFLRQAGEDAVLVFTGSVMKHEGAFERTQRKIDMLGLHERVIITGYLADKALKIVTANAEAAIVTSFYEGFPAPVIECFSCGVPVIATARGAIPEVAGDAAILIEPYDPRGLAEALARILGNSAEHSVYVQKGIDRAKAFSWEKLAGEILKVYTALVKA
ncbi:MAG: glycosyltransferase family 4 protein [Candidatus Omnitrophica bacterium]|nr:glycosyltransferase family 4 protein [Candidatus Omnitrophota bacterium]